MFVWFLKTGIPREGHATASRGLREGQIILKKLVNKAYKSLTS